jgi:hypothetical protein
MALDGSPWPQKQAVFPETTTAIDRLRGVLGDQVHEQLARKGEMTSMSAM